MLPGTDHSSGLRCPVHKTVVGFCMVCVSQGARWSDIYSGQSASPSPISSLDSEMSGTNSLKSIIHHSSHSKIFHLHIYLNKRHHHPPTGPGYDEILNSVLIFLYPSYIILSALEKSTFYLLKHQGDQTSQS